ncbi:MAG TPA: TlpA family protein disulfide reductase [Fimbriimonas sp.]|nr:TlpA family protein disulfide reductase [Fimbriimonas sp.]
MRVLPYIAIACVAALLAGCDTESDPDHPLVGKPAPDFQIDPLNPAQPKVALSDMKGKVVILDFWATWCGPCRALTPFVEKVYKDHQAEGVQAMAITDEGRADVEKFEKNSPHEMPVFLDANRISLNEYGADAIPLIVVIDKKGQVAFEQTGYMPGELEVAGATIDAAVVKALKES